MIAVLGLLTGPALFVADSHAAPAMQDVVSPGGIHAVLVQDAAVPTIRLSFAFDGGAAQDPADRPGVARLVAYLLDQGAGHLDSRSFRDQLDRLAIGLQFYAGPDNFYGYLHTLGSNKEEAFNMLGLALSSARFDRADVDRIRARELSWLDRKSTIPPLVGSRKAVEMAFPNHPYGRPDGGSVESIKAITIDDLRDYTSHVFAKDTLKIAVIGDIDPQTLGILLDKAFGSLPSKATLRPVPDVIATLPLRRVLVTLKNPQTEILFIAPGIPLGDQDYTAATLVCDILSGSGLSSRLFQSIRETRGLTYSISGGLRTLTHSALFVGHAASRSDRVGETTAAIEEDVRRMAETGPTEQELAIAKSHLAGSELLKMSEPGTLVGSILWSEIHRQPIGFGARKALIDAVTLPDAKRVAKRLWGNGVSMILVGSAANESIDSDHTQQQQP
ncbi:insulinase family protein [Bradyrhizobium sp. 83012]|uniref:Insulinase family protein n=2 Tax=Bradyrhizobium aeschynomenes TaxID=2734909 RepID=A0ABX2CNH5_9BRAD|nr:pitrilysin family protein [Bradyrhizobium aeschynomenes]NPU15644.1 insulinase family protein [Bradyrhizobium aeschynomenes]NPU69701.1 insulinase family protein [Bradyrhizobium aeschynomenes]NPV24642.1 insulinase family protein [Bradyrhizobium aeschynomenes]